MYDGKKPQRQHTSVDEGQVRDVDELAGEWGLRVNWEAKRHEGVCSSQRPSNSPKRRSCFYVTRALGMTQVSAVEIVERAEGEVILGRTYDQAYASTQEMVTVSRIPK